MHQNRFLFQNSRCGAIRPARLDEGKKTSIGSVLRAWEALTGQIPHRGMSCSMGRPSLWLQEHQSHHLRPWMERAGVGQCLRWSHGHGGALPHHLCSSTLNLNLTLWHPLLSIQCSNPSKLPQFRSGSALAAKFNSNTDTTAMPVPQESEKCCNNPKQHWQKHFLPGKLVEPGSASDGDRS